MSTARTPVPIVRTMPARLAKDPRGASCHLRGCATGESQQQNALGIRSVENEVSDAMGKRLRLARSGARDDQKRRRQRSAILMPYSTAALWLSFRSIESPRQTQASSIALKVRIGPNAGHPLYK